MIALLFQFTFYTPAANIIHPPSTTEEVVFAARLIKQYCNTPKFTNVQISFVNKFLTPNTLAICVNQTAPHKIILVSQLEWNRSSVQRRKTIMLHEFAHCLLHIKHVDIKGHFMYYLIYDEGVKDENMHNELKSLCDADKRLWKGPRGR
jgi:hypothetical protein